MTQTLYGIRSNSCGQTFWRSFASVNNVGTRKAPFHCVKGRAFKRCRASCYNNLMTNQYDVIICGAGPAGACAGYEAASAGLKTLILEKRTLPRYKTCGGGVPLTVGE